ncbi:MAG: hypothetical protein LIO50_04785 [Phascolarctobacterium sp.]|uniref:cyclophilin-like fold protein n=1 Tax=Phascolarctobacterium sp. TaxID=2049039 RepID=UPI0025D7CFE9|nr:cyclophilin-like fold protein [Phascolarctobacterium sp.]MCC8158524.1 hypothetical protein [Phascolarctobacterium sp.]
MKKILLAFVCAACAATVASMALYASSPAAEPAPLTQTQQTAAITTNAAVLINGRQIPILWEATPLAKELQSRFPLRVNMVGYGQREYYGPLSWHPADPGRGRLNFDDGDITYCPRNNTLAIFYSQSSQPNLTMEVIKVGSVPSEQLPLFHQLGGSIEAVFTMQQ